MLSRMRYGFISKLGIPEDEERNIGSKGLKKKKKKIKDSFQ